MTMPNRSVSQRAAALTAVGGAVAAGAALLLAQQAIGQPPPSTVCPDGNPTPADDGTCEVLFTTTGATTWTVPTRTRSRTHHQNSDRLARPPNRA